MSFAILEPSDQLSEVCRKAGSKNIVMLCSAHDEGFNLEEAWPAAHADSWTIAACDNYGKVLHETKQTYDYAIPGVDVRAGIVPFLDSNDRISGSSVATAIAAGLSSLILSCDTFAHPDITPSVRETKRKKRLQNHLKKMVSYPDSKYIMLEKLCDLDRKTLNGDHITASKYISGEWFSHRDDVSICCSVSFILPWVSDFQNLNGITLISCALIQGILMASSGTERNLLKVCCNFQLMKSP